MYTLPDVKLFDYQSSELKKINKHLKVSCLPNCCTAFQHMHIYRYEYSIYHTIHNIFNDLMN